MNMEDRISYLPNELRTHILTFLPIEDAVRTCILSKRWIDVWTYMPILVFDDHKSLEDNLTDVDFLLCDFKLLLFMHYVLSRRQTSLLDTFKLTWCGKFRVTYSYISALLSSAASHMPRVLSVNIETKEPFILPGSIFTCPSVEEMSLELYYDDIRYGCIKAELINLPRLRKLELHYQMINDAFITMLFSGCPILEELVFDGCNFKTNEISSTVLKKLTFKECAPINEIQISCPSVISVNIETKEPFKLPGSIFTCPSVEEMSLAVYYINLFERTGAESINLPRLRKLELHYLLINDDFITMLFSGCPILEELVFDTCTFSTDQISSTILKKLTFKGCVPLNEIQISCPSVVSLDIDFFDSEGITLRNMPSLVTANLAFGSSINYFDYDLKLLSALSNVSSLRLSTNLLKDLQTKDLPNCPNFNNLKSLDLGELDMNLHWKLVGCLLQHSPNLETLTLHFCDCQPSEDATKEELTGDVIPFQLEYLKTLNIFCCNTNEKFAEEVVRRLSVSIKSIGEVTTRHKCRLHGMEID